MTGGPAQVSMAAALEPGDFVFARGKSWIVEWAEKAGSVQTLHLVSCEDDSQGAHTPREIAETTLVM